MFLMAVRKSVILSLLLLILGVGLGFLALFLFQDDIPRFGIEREGASRFAIQSRVPGIEISLADPDILEKYAKEFKVFENERIGIFVDPITVRWTTAEKITFVYSPEPQRMVEISSPNGEPALSFDIIDRGNGNIEIVFKSSFRRETKEAREKGMTVDLIRLLYRATHYNPKATYSEDEIFELTNGIYSRAVDINNK